jgi:hypothetical protein
LSGCRKIENLFNERTRDQKFYQNSALFIQGGAEKQENLKLMLAAL